MQQLANHLQYPFYAFHTILAYLKHGTILNKASCLPLESHPLFVTWKARSSFEEVLRGCIGTFSHESIQTTLPLFSLLSAFRDSRFRPISLREVPALKCTVSLLQNFEKLKNPYDWKVGTDGVSLAFEHNGKQYSSTFLPEVAEEQGWDQKQTVKELIRKAGFKGSIAAIQDKLMVERYNSMLCSARYEEYEKFMLQNENAFE